MTQARRTLLAALIAPLATTLLMLLPQLTGSGQLDLGTQNAKVVALLILGASYALSYTFGVPIYLFARRRYWRTWRAYIGGAFLMGLAAYPTVVLVLLTYAGLFYPEKLLEEVRLFSNIHVWFAPLWIGLLSTPIGLLFWVIVRPDRSI
jgi:hypothetical protein